jgi:hypothetical protein
MGVLNHETEGGFMKRHFPRLKDVLPEFDILNSRYRSTTNTDELLYGPPPEAPPPAVEPEAPPLVDGRLAAALIDGGLTSAVIH